MKLKVEICKSCVDSKLESMELKRERDFYCRKCENYERQLAEYDNRNAERDKLLAETQKVATQLKDLLSKFAKLDAQHENDENEGEGNESQDWNESLNCDSLKDPEPDDTVHPALHCPVSPEVRLSEENVPEQNTTSRTENQKPAKKAFYQICRWNIENSSSSSKLCAKVCKATDLASHIIDDHLRASATKDICLWENCEVYGQQFKPETDILFHIHSHTFRALHRCTVENCSMEFFHAQDLEKHKYFHLSELDANNTFRCRYKNCRKTFFTFQNLTEHEGRHKVKCMLCDKVFRSTSYLNKHMRKSHKFHETEGKQVDREPNLTEMSVDRDTNLTEKSVDRETNLTEMSLDRDTNLTEKSVDRETNLTEMSVDRETNLTEKSVDRETNLTEKSVDRETNRTEKSVYCETDPPKKSVDLEPNLPENAVESQSNTITITEVKSLVQDKETIDNVKYHCGNKYPDNVLDRETNPPKMLVDRETNPPENAVESETNTMTITVVKSVVQDKETIDNLKYHCVNKHQDNVFDLETNPPIKSLDRETNPPEKTVESQTNTIMQTIEKTLVQDENSSDYVKYYCVEGYPTNNLDRDTNPPVKAVESRNTITITEVKSSVRQDNKDKSESVKDCCDEWWNSAKLSATDTLHPFRKRPKMGTLFQSKVKFNGKVTNAKQECKSNKNQERRDNLNRDSLKDPVPDTMDNPDVRCPVSLEVKLGEEKVPEQNPAIGPENPKVKKKAFYQICRWKIEMSASSSKLCAKVCASSDLVGHIVSDHLSASDTWDTCLWQKCKFFGRHLKPETDIFCHIHSHIFRAKHRCSVENCGMEFFHKQDLKKHKYVHRSKVEA